MSKEKIYIGTSGWSYPSWYDIFYPPDIASNKLLEYYSKTFKTVEINSSFYHSIQPSVYKNWYNETPKDFIFSIKASRYITHTKKLKDAKESWQTFEKSFQNLKEKIGVILFQLPPNFKKDFERLESFLKILPKKYRYTFEFRNESWFDEEIYSLLKKFNCALCVASTPNYPLVEKITADFVYLRLHGSKILYASEYTIKELKQWAKKIKDWQGQGMDCYIYFDNDYEARAVEDAKELIALTS
jgi:uncharacterized protein YecE (DUF72 family)